MPRPLIEQTFVSGSIGVTASAQPISNLDLSSMCQAFIICNPSSNTQSVFWGDQNVTTTTGIEITPGSAPLFSVGGIRQLYELQDPMRIAASAAACQVAPDVAIPVVCWYPAHINIIAAVAGPTVVSLLFFRNVYA